MADYRLLKAQSQIGVSTAFKRTSSADGKSPSVQFGIIDCRTTYKYG